MNQISVILLRLRQVLTEPFVTGMDGAAGREVLRRLLLHE